MQYRRYLILIGLFAVPLCASAQWLNHPDANIPRLRDGKPNLSAPAPRVGGKPDLSGIWQTEGSPRTVLASLFPPGVGILPGGVNGLGEYDPHKYFLNFLADFKPGEEPLTPAAAARFRKQMQSNEKPPTLCAPPSVPVTELVPAPFKIVHTPGLMLMLYEGDTMFFRQIYMDGRKPPADPQPSFLGNSVGHWEGDSLVIDVTGFNDRGHLDAMGHFNSEALHVTERFHRVDFGHMDAQITIEDPKIYTKPVTIHVKMNLLPDTDLIESFCTEAESDLAHIPGK